MNFQFVYYKGKAPWQGEKEEEHRGRKDDFRLEKQERINKCLNCEKTICTNCLEKVSIRLKKARI